MCNQEVKIGVKLNLRSFRAILNILLTEMLSRCTIVMCNVLCYDGKANEPTFCYKFCSCSYNQSQTTITTYVVILKIGFSGCGGLSYSI